MESGIDFHRPISREGDFDFLLSLLGKGLPVSPSIVVSGPPGCGKSTLVRSVIAYSAKSTPSFRHIDVSCLEACLSNSSGGGSSAQNLVLFDLILYQFKFHYLSSVADFEHRCNNPASFIERLSELFLKISGKDPAFATFCISLHQAEKLRDASDYLLPIIVNLNSLVREHIRIISPGVKAPNVVTILLTPCSWDKFFSGTFASEPTTLHLKAYSREQLANIIIRYGSVDSPRYARFVDLLLTVCLPVTRKVTELLYLAKFNWKAFDEPVASGLVSADDEWAQYRHALPTLKRSLSTIYLRPELSDINEPSEMSKLATATKFGFTVASDNVKNALELPLYARYILVAAYMASYNPKSADKRFLVKVNNHLIGPRLFPLDRLLAIFYAVLDLEGEEDPRPPLSSLLVGQIASLSSLGLIAAASSTVAAGTAVFSEVGLPGPYSNPEDPLANPRYRCLITLETARAVAKSINVNLNQHLLDFV